MYTEFRKHLKMNASDSFLQIQQLEKIGAYQEAIELLTKLVILNEFEANCISSYGISGSPYKELAKIYHRLGDMQSEIEILERFLLHDRLRGNVKALIADRYLALSQELRYSIPSDMRIRVEAIRRMGRKELRIMNRVRIQSKRSRRDSHRVLLNVPLQQRM